MSNPLPLPTLAAALIAEGLAQIQLTHPAVSYEGATLRALPALEGRRALEVWTRASGWQLAGHAAPLPGAAPAVVMDPPAVPPALLDRPAVPVGSVEVCRARLSPWGPDAAAVVADRASLRLQVPLALRERVAQAAALQSDRLDVPELVVFVSPVGRFLQGLYFVT